MRVLLLFAVAVVLATPRPGDGQPAPPKTLADRMLRILKRTDDQPADYVIALGPASAGAVARSERLRGRVARMTYFDEAAATPAAILAEWEATLADGGYEVLYKGQGAALGGKAFARAAGYANVHLRPGLTVALFASDDHAYLATRRVDGDKDVYFAMYATRVPATLLKSVLEPRRDDVLVQQDIDYRFR